MVHLREHRDLAAGQALDHVHLPERPRPVQGDAGQVQAGHHAEELELVGHGEREDRVLAEGRLALEVFSGVSRVPQRVKCATMAWHALHSALQEAVGSAPGE